MRPLPLTLTEPIGVDDVTHQVTSSTFRRLTAVRWSTRGVDKQNASDVRTVSTPIVTEHTQRQ